MRIVIRDDAGSVLLDSVSGGLRGAAVVARAARRAGVAVTVFEGSRPRRRYEGQDGEHAYLEPCPVCGELKRKPGRLRCPSCRMRKGWQ